MQMGGQGGTPSIQRPNPCTPPLVLSSASTLFRGGKEGPPGSVSFLTHARTCAMRGSCFGIEFLRSWARSTPGLAYRTRGCSGRGSSRSTAAGRRAAAAGAAGRRAHRIALKESIYSHFTSRGFATTTMVSIPRRIVHTRVRGLAPKCPLLPRTHAPALGH